MKFKHILILIFFVSNAKVKFFFSQYIIVKHNSTKLSFGSLLKYANCFQIMTYSFFFSFVTQVMTKYYS